MSSSRNRGASSESRRHVAVGGCAGLIAALALGVLVASTFQWPPRLDRAPHEAAGRLLAQEALRHLAPGGRLTVITRDTSDFKQPAPDVLFAAFKRAVQRAGATVAAVHALEVDPLRLVEVPSGDFMELMAKATTGSVIVSLMGPPLLAPEQRLQLGQIRPSIVAFCPGNQPAQIDLRQVFAQGALEVAVVSRPHSPAASRRAPAGGSDPYDILTVTNVGAWYASGGAPR